ncbi:MAG: hypothetical protein WA765_01245 [Candidatus Acidiferrum sp.]
MEKVGRIWATEELEVEEVKDLKEREGAKRPEEEMDGFCEKNMEDRSSELARE